MNSYFLCLIVMIISFTNVYVGAKKKCESGQLIKQIQIQTYRGHKKPRLTTFCGKHESEKLKDCGKGDKPKQIADVKRYNSSCLHEEDPRTIHRPSLNRPQAVRNAVEQCSVNKTHVAMATRSDRTSKSAEIQFFCQQTNCAWDCETRTEVIESDMAFNISAEEVFKSKYEEDNFKDAFFSKFTVRKSKKDYRVKYRVCRDCRRVVVPVAPVVVTVAPVVVPDAPVLVIGQSQCNGNTDYKELTGQHAGCCTKFFQAPVSQKDAAAACSGRGSTILGIKTKYLLEHAAAYPGYRFWSGGTYQLSTESMSFYDGGSLSEAEIYNMIVYLYHRQTDSGDVFPVFSSTLDFYISNPYALEASYLCGINC